jgi:UDP-N-acetylglucosamine 2-epimerase (non-hydrolysing)
MRGRAADDRFLNTVRSGYGFVTLHRPSNVDDPEKLAGLVDALIEIAALLPLVFAMHPRTRERIDAAELGAKLADASILVTPPLSYLETLGMMRTARLAITDSGGVQEETTALGVPCLTVRDNTERPITITEGTNTLVGSSPQALLAAAREALGGTGKRGRVPELWDGKAAERVVRHVVEFVARRKMVAA